MALDGIRQKNRPKKSACFLMLVRTERLELSCLSAPEPKSGASTNEIRIRFFAVVGSADISKLSVQSGIKLGNVVVKQGNLLVQAVDFNQAAGQIGVFFGYGVFNIPIGEDTADTG